MKLHLLALTLIAAPPAMGQVANTPQIAATIKSLGPDLSREMVGGTFKAYGPLHAAQNTDGVSVTADQPYGAHERHSLDIYAPEGAKNAPVMIFVHGGGFVRGDKKGAANIGAWFAQHGIVTLAINYRFAPEIQWPAGAEDIKNVLAWAAQNVAQYGGDPSKIVLAGNSAGAMHVADYTFREELQRENDGVIGAIMISTPTADLQNRPVDPNRDALYYGTDGDRAAQSVVNAVSGRKIPVMIGYAEYEPDVIMDQTHRLIEALTLRDGRMPVINAAAGHSHISIVEHIGTADNTIAPDMYEFITTLAISQ